MNGNNLLILICVMVIAGCQSDIEKKDKNVAEVKIANKQQLSDSNYNSNSKIDSSIIIKVKPEKFITKYITVLIHENKNDSTLSELEIAENIITFFVPNNQHEVLKKFRKNGFPMEFWGTEMCPFFGIFYSELESKIEIAKKLGFSDYGFKCEISKNEISKSAVLTNELVIQFKPSVLYEEVQNILTSDNSSNFYKIDYLPNTYSVKLANRSAKNIVKIYNKLIKNNNVEFVQFVFGGCARNEIHFDG